MQTKEPIQYLSPPQAKNIKSGRLGWR